MSEFQKIWEEFNSKVINAEAGETQRREMKAAFYGGAAALFALQMNVADRNLPQEEEYRTFENIRQEIFSFRPE
jgi:hypothetical protein